MIIIKKYLLIAEKPSLMRECRNTYFNHRKEIPYNIDFVALSGHVCGYAEPREYPNWNVKWAELTLPLIPDTWKVNVNPDKSKVVSDIKKLISNNSYDGFICATDADREGNLIYHLLETKLKLTKKETLRLWVHDLTDEKILEAFLNMVDLHKNQKQKNLTLASVLRSRFDWEIGMNITIAATVKSNMEMKVGRVKSPTLKLIYDNSMAIDNFVPKTTYELLSEYDKGFSGVYVDEKYVPVEFLKKQEAIDFLAKNFNTSAKVERVERKTVKTNAPQLYKLSDIQIEASKKFGYSPQKTLDLVQSLYENHKIVSYPRCDCRYVSLSITNDFQKFIDNVSSIPEFKAVAKSITTNQINDVKNNSKYVNDKEVNKNSHTALLPTTKKPVLTDLSEDETNVLKMIYSRFLSIFLPPLIEEMTTIITNNNGFKFKSTGKVVIDKGYTDFIQKKSVDTLLPKVNEGDILSVKEIISKDKTSSPPVRLTDGTLIEEMTNIGKYVEDKELRQILKETKGIGTQATRAKIISDLIKDGYVDTKKTKKTNQLYISDKGKTYIENLKDFDIIMPELTALWEDKLQKVEIGEYDAVTFNNEMLSYLKEIIKDISKIKMNKATNPDRKVLGSCPRCGKDIIEGKKAYGCMGFKDDPKCSFSIWKDNSFFSSQGKKLTPTIIEKILKDKNHKTLVKGFKSKKGNKYDATVVLEDTGSGFANLKIEFLNKK